jgi:hypothetical protein
MESAGHGLFVPAHSSRPCIQSIHLVERFLVLLQDQAPILNEAEDIRIILHCDDEILS